MAMFYGFKAGGSGARGGEPTCSTAARLYDTYQCADGKWISIGSIEPQFYLLLLEKTGISDPQFQHQMSREDWPELREKLAAVIKTKSRDDWCAIMAPPTSVPRRS
ncbi:CoA transferase [Caulobacter segnis]